MSPLMAKTATIPRITQSIVFIIILYARFLHDRMYDFNKKKSRDLDRIRFYGLQNTGGDCASRRFPDGYFYRPGE
jgi:hypothetical protein